MNTCREPCDSQMLRTDRPEPDTSWSRRASRPGLHGAVSFDAKVTRYRDLAGSHRACREPNSLCRRLPCSPPPQKAADHPSSIFSLHQLDVADKLCAAPPAFENDLAVVKRLELRPV